MDDMMRDKIEKIYDMQINQTTDIAVIRAYQKSIVEKIGKLEVGQDKNTAYRQKSMGAIAFIYVLIGIFGSLLAKKLSGME